tara:strand:+ start:106 stop:441 length:336 start_codon:yes stop_codon:yes gene_type:complete
LKLDLEAFGARGASCRTKSGCSAVKPRILALSLSHNVHERSTLQMSLDAALASHAHLADGQDGEHAVELRGLRVVHRQRFSKWLHFLGMRSASGTKIEAILKLNADNAQTG